MIATPIQSNQAFSAAGGSSSFETLSFSNGGGVSFTNSNGQVAATVQTNYLTTGALSNHSHGVSFTSGSVGFQTLSFTNSNGISFNSGTQGIFASHNALTTARASNDAIGLNTAITQNGVSMTANSSGLSLNFPAFLTTAALSNHSHGVSFTSGSVGFQTLSFTNSNGISFNSGTQGIFGSHNAITTGRASNDAIGLNTALTANGVSMTANSSGLSLNFPAFLTTAALPNHSHGVSFTSGSVGFQTLSFTNSNGISFNSGTQGIFGSHNAITTGRASNDGVGLATAQTNVTWTVNSAGISFNGAGYAGTGLSLTNATATLNSNGLQLSVGGGGVTNQTGPNISAGTDSLFTSGTVTFGNAFNGSFVTSNGSVVLSNAFLTTARASTDGIGLATAQTNVTWTVNSAGLSFNAGGYAGTGTTFNGANISASLTQNSNGIQISASVGAAGGGVTMSTYEPAQALGASTVLVGVPTGTSAGISVYPFIVDQNVSVGIMNLALSMSYQTISNSSGRHTWGLAAGIYSQNVSTLSSMASASFSIGVTANNSSYSFNQPTSTAYTGYATGDTNSAGSNISSGYTGVKLVGFPMDILLTPGPYWLAVIGTRNSNSISNGLLASFYGMAMGTFGSAMAPIGSYSSSWTSGLNPRGGRWNLMQGSWTSAGSVTMIPPTMAHNSISAVGHTYPVIKFWRT